MNEINEMTLRMCGVILVASFLLATGRSNSITDVNLSCLSCPDYWYNDDEFNQASVDYDMFDRAITKRVAENSDNNFLLSPLGLKLPLAVLAEAAIGITQKELLWALGFDLDRNIVRRKFTNVIAMLKKESPAYIVNFGSRIYVDDSAQLRERISAIAQEFYKTELRSTNLKELAIAENEINEWVSNITSGKVANLVEEGHLRNMSVLVLNALDFKGTWHHQFPPNATKSGTFYVSAKVWKIARFMNVKNNFYYGESAKLGAKILRMPYRGSKFAMYIILPNSLTGLQHVVQGLEDLRLELGNLKERIVDVTLPKFNFDYSSELDSVFKKLGVQYMFEVTASFPGIASRQQSQGLRVSRILQHSGIVVDELGSIVYTGSESQGNMSDEETFEKYKMDVNRPFLFYIQDESSRQILLIGRVSDPTI